MTVPKKSTVKKPEAKPLEEIQDAEIVEEEIEEVEEIKPKREVKKMEERALSLDEIAMRTKKDMEDYPKVHLLVPPNAFGTGEDTIIEINLNGYKWWLKPSEEYDLPKPIYDQFMYSYLATQRARGRIK